MNPSRIEQIKELFLKLKKGHFWYMRHQDETERIKELLNRSEPIFKELESLGVDKTFSLNLLIFGPLVTDELVNKFENQTKGGE